MFLLFYAVDLPMIVTKMRSPRMAVRQDIMINSSSPLDSGFKSISLLMLELLALYIKVSFR